MQARGSVLSAFSKEYVLFPNLLMQVVHCNSDIDFTLTASIVHPYSVAMNGFGVVRWVVHDLPTGGLDVKRMLRNHLSG